MQELEGKVALITGAGSGIGQATALCFAQQGARVAVLDLSDDNVKQTVEQITQKGGQALGIVADVSQVSDMQQAIEQIQQQWDRLDVVFANAGINGVWAPIDEIEPEEWDQTININLRGTFLTVKYALPLLKVAGGAILITSSVNGTRTFSNTGATAYSCSKAAQVAFAKMTALELAKYRIRVNVICPGAIDTHIDQSTQQRNLEREQEPVVFPEGKTPLTDGAPGNAEQVAQLALFLASDRASHITGTPIWIDGAESLIKA
ncbi:SDR family oxidoreductase [Spirosoma oryzicola]|uniref:SDR family oxidoreductase n=1 Tax=Spirosoma oryzicola TaxID=2898794 RepID=UPI001E4F0AF1|nr:SDR family NAD(P)-dependent oxidoreductase [Spirosoma oryzicola]UHG94185.1 SDR family oxidoreductase [Spirosoma oryzicola]